MSKRTTKSALLTSSISLLLCFAMLLGTTFAWFTDTVTSANNIIKSGNLDITLEYLKGDEWVDVKGASDILTNELWEPGVTEVAYLKLKNAGSLALKYQFGINIVSETEGVNVAGNTFKLSDYIKFGVVENVNGMTGEYANREAAVAAVTDPKNISAGYTKAPEAGMNSGDELYLALVVWMPTTVGNEANHNGEDIPQIDLGINVVATQLTYEEDSFDNLYDQDVAYPAAAVVTVPENGTAVEVKAGNFNVTVPETVTAAGDVYEVVVSNTNTSTDNATGETSVSFDLTLYKNDVKVSGDTIYEVEWNIGEGKVVSAVEHNGVAMTEATTGADQTYTYDAATGILTLYTKSFSPFEAFYMDKDVVNNAEAFATLIKEGGEGKLYGKFTVEDFNNPVGGSSGIRKGVTITGGTLSRDSGNGNALTVYTDEKVTFNNVAFETVKGNAVLETRKDGSHIEVNNSTFTNFSAPSTGNTAVQVYANDTTVTFNNCVFNNSPILTNYSYRENLKLVFNNCTFNWNGDNCSGFIQIANSVDVQVDINDCIMNYTTNSQYDKIKNLISYGTSSKAVININGLKVVGTRNNEKIWKIVSPYNTGATVNTSGTLEYIFNGEPIDFATYLK